jgi:hypothetical protein
LELQRPAEPDGATDPEGATEPEGATVAEAGGAGFAVAVGAAVGAAVGVAEAEPQPDTSTTARTAPSKAGITVLERRIIDYPIRLESWSHRAWRHLRPRVKRAAPASFVESGHRL